MTTIKGSCMCGAVCYEADGPLRDIVACHCVECRKASGHYTAATAVKPGNLSVSETGGLRWYRASDNAQRGFCQYCGSTLFWKPDSGDRISIYAGSIDGDPGLSVKAHIFLDEKGAYYEIEASEGVQRLGKGGAPLEVP